jgi:N-acyl-D-amino-acid deacylase
MFDTLILGSKLVDGTGSPWRYADIGIKDGKIAAIGQLQGLPRKHEIPAGDLITCPGFIDMHAHTDIALLSGQLMEYRLLQGITTEVIGQDGLAYAPCSLEHLQEWRGYLSSLNGDLLPEQDWNWLSVADLLARYENKASNVVLHIPHGAVRVEVVGWDDRPATKAELQEMQKLVMQGMAQGAIGLSTGLNYMPCMSGTTEEMIALCEPVADMHGILSVHLRSYAGKFLEALEEVFEVGRQTGCGIHLSHLRIADRSNWGKSNLVLEMIDRARDEGIEVTCDLYPYSVGNAPLFLLTPGWLQAGGPKQLLQKLADPNSRIKAAREMDAWNLDWSIYPLSNCPKTEFGDWEGASLTTAAQAKGMKVTDFVLELLHHTQLNTAIIAAGGSEADNDVIFTHPTCMVCSDGLLIGGHPHPRGFGAFPRFIREYAFTRNILSLEEAVYRMTGLTASRLNLQDRGIIRKGMAADLVIFNPNEIQDRADYHQSKVPPTGIEWVFVNGNCVVDKGQYQGSHFGHALKPLMN